MQADAIEARSLRTLGLLTRGALHEISNPLVALLGSAELALEDVEPDTKLHDRIALAHRTGAEIAGIVRALQAFIRLQDQPAGALSLGDAAAETVALAELVLPTHDVTLSASGDATVVAAPGDLRCSLVELLVEALERSGSRGSISLTVRSDGGEALVQATGGGELRLPAAAVAS
jgi:two-component system sensor histidine kinase PilS (NtrC family)